MPLKEEFIAHISQEKGDTMPLRPRGEHQVWLGGKSRREKQERKS